LAEEGGRLVDVQDSSSTGFHRLGISAEEFTQANRDSKEVMVPSGHLLIFFERMLHAVADMPSRSRLTVTPAERKAHMLRLFTGSMLTFQGDACRYPELRASLSHLGRMPDKGGGHVPVAPRSRQWGTMKKLDNRQKFETWMRTTVRKEFWPAAWGTVWKDEEQTMEVTGQVPEASWPTMMELRENYGVSYDEVKYPPYDETELRMYDVTPLVEDIE
jgi:hypothetical protein